MQNKIYSVIKKFYTLNSEFKEYEKKFALKKEQLMSVLDEYFDTHDETEISIESTAGDVYTCKKVQSSKVIFDIDKIEKKYGRKDCSTFIDRKYTINDFKGLVKLLKSYGVKSEEFKKFIDVDKTVNESNLNKLYEMGILKIEDLEGMYTIRKNKPYYKVNKK